MPLFDDLSPWLNAVAFLLSGALIWYAGTRLSGYTDAIAERTGLGRALLGALLLGGVTSLPEIVVGLVASWLGAVRMALSNVMGGIAMQVAVLALADGLIPAASLSALNQRSSVLLQAALLIVPLTVVLATVVIGDVSLLGVGAGTLLTAVLVTAAFYLIHRHRPPRAWAAGSDSVARGQSEGAASSTPPQMQMRLAQLLSRTVLAALAITVGGTILAGAGNALAQQTGLGESFFGFLFLAVATSLPEVSTTAAAVRLGRYAMALSNIFGTNLFDIAIVFVIDLAYAGGPALNQVGRQDALGITLGILVTALYLVGLVERQPRTYWRLGVDSWAVLAVYSAGVVALYVLR